MCICIRATAIDSDVTVTWELVGRVRTYENPGSARAREHYTKGALRAFCIVGHQNDRNMARFFNVGENPLNRPSTDDIT